MTSSTTRRVAHLSADTDSIDEEAPRVDDDPDIEVVGPGAGEEDRTDQHDEGVLAETELATDPVSLDTDDRLTDDDTASLSVVDGVDPVCRRFEGSKSETDGRAAMRESVNSLSSQTVGLFPQHCGQVLAKSDLRLPIEKRTKPVVAEFRCRSAKAILPPSRMNRDSPSTKRPIPVRTYLFQYAFKGAPGSCLNRAHVSRNSRPHSVVNCLLTKRLRSARGRSAQ